MYLHRFLRLTPVLGFAILAYMSVLPIMGGGPVSSGYLDASVETCKENWYLTLLYVQNYATGTNDMVSCKRIEEGGVLIECDCSA